MGGSAPLEVRVQCATAASMFSAVVAWILWLDFSLMLLTRYIRASRTMGTTCDQSLKTSSLCET